MGVAHAEPRSPGRRAGLPRPRGTGPDPGAPAPQWDRRLRDPLPAAVASRRSEVGELDAGVCEPLRIDLAPDERPQVLVHVPDVDVHRGAHRTVAQPERDELTRAQ